MPELREALSAALEETPLVDKTEAPAVVETTPAPDTTTPVDDKTEAPAKVETTSEEGKEMVRDALGRFVPKTPEVKTEAPAQQPQEDATIAKPPVSWSVTAKQDWANLPPTVRQEVMKRERETQQVLSTTAQARDVAQRLSQTVQPFMHAIQAETGGDVFAAVSGLMKTASTLRFGTPAEKAQTVAQLVNVYGIDIMALDSALAGVMPAQQPQGFDPSIVQREVQQALAPLMQQAQARQQEAQQRAAQEARTELERFAADPKHEFFEDVRDIMADIVELNTTRGVQITLEEVYNRACLAHPEVAKLVTSKMQQSSAQSLTQAAQRAKLAASSVTGAAPRGEPSTTEPTSVRNAIEAAIDSHTRI